MNALAQPPPNRGAEFDAHMGAENHLDHALIELCSRIDVSVSLLLHMIREVDAHAECFEGGPPEVADWLSERCDVGLSAAREYVRCARALKTLPRLMAAFAQGGLSYSKIRVMTFVATPGNEAALMTYAIEHTTAEVESHCWHLSNTSGDEG